MDDSNRPKCSRNKDKKSDDLNAPFKTFHQNVRSLKGKINELMLSLVNDEPSIICLSEHHLNVYEMDYYYNYYNITSKIVDDQIKLPKVKKQNFKV
jgi:hypothetical protein